MRKKYFALISLMLLGNFVIAQTSLTPPQPLSVNFYSNEEISNYFATYPGTTQLQNVIVGGEVTFVGALNTLTHVDALEIITNHPVSGFNNLQTIGSGGLTIEGFYNPETFTYGTFSGLGNLTSIDGPVSIQANTSGFGSLNTVNGYIDISDYNIITIPAFESLVTVGSIFILHTNLSTINSFNALLSAQRILIGDNDNLTSLNGFDSCQTLPDLIIMENSNLTAINAFSNLQNCSIELLITNLPNLQSISGFGSLTDVQTYNFYGNGCPHLPNSPLLANIFSLQISNNPLLVDLNGLNGLTTVSYYFTLQNNPALNTLTHLNSFTTLENMSISNCNSLTSFSGLNNLTQVHNLSIFDNASLTSLTGLDNINSGAIVGLGIYNNPLLTTCAVESVCDKIALQDSQTSICCNATDCNSVEEVAAICNLLHTDESELNDAFKVYPNPVSTMLNIDTFGKQIRQINIYGALGQAAYKAPMITRENKVAINIESLQTGIYFAEIITDKSSTIKKVVKN